MIEKLRASWIGLAKWYVAEAPWIAAILFITTLVFVAGAMSVGWKGWIDFVSKDAVHGWAAAIATGTAALIALGIALQTQKEKAREAKRLGEVLAARHRDLLEVVVHEMELQLKSFAGKSFSENDLATDYRPTIEQDLISTRKKLESCDVAALLPYSESLAAMIVATAGQLHLAHSFAREPGNVAAVAGILEESVERILTAHSCTAPAFDRLVRTHLRIMKQEGLGD
ncbi:hypothetical protein CEG14_18030 [Bordetella genomosp. 1]|uniref:Uncharacterized protein n=1 Tax=Bordetella genomosp. 1 TaxID=1395607 RepID=A0A261S6P0_9BORD|nr:hypothetical protein [Bordetella genomosp. 1]OZI32791.1 hypothetical protein CEG14_18030 [Bordetella genomosp. 1]